MDSRKRETYQTEPRTYVLFTFELDDECKIVKTLVIKENILNLHPGWMDEKVATENMGLCSFYTMHHTRYYIALYICITRYAVKLIDHVQRTNILYRTAALSDERK